MRLTALHLLLLALAALCHLSTVPVEARGLSFGQPSGSRRVLLKKKKKGNTKDEQDQAEREAAQLAAQQAELAELVAEGTAEISKQAAKEAKKAAKAAKEQKIREAEQLADQVRERADNAKRDGAQEAEQEALEKEARDSEKEARKAAKKAEKKARKEAEEAAQEEEEKEQDDDDDNKKKSKKEESSDGGDEEVAAASTSGGSYGNSNRGDGVIWGMETGQGGSGPVARATYHYYAPGYETSSLYCADQFNKFLPVSSDHWLLQYPWTAYCNDDGLGPMSQDKCGKCLKVTNTATGQSVKTRVVDMCGQGGVDMDPLGFNAIDGDGQGKATGDMAVRLDWC